MIIRLHNQPKLQLKDLLRRRKTTFETWLTDVGISTFTELVRWCDNVGVKAPTKAEWSKVKPKLADRSVNSPADGLVVIEPPPEAPRKIKRTRKKVTTPVTKNIPETP